MYNLLICSDPNSFRGEPWTLERARVLEYTQEMIASPYQALEPETFEQLSRFPAVLGYERGNDRNARFARIDRVRQRQNEIRVEYTFAPGLPEIPHELLETRAWELDLGRMELTRTHWALKDVNLAEEVVGAGLVTRDQLAALPAGFIHLFGLAAPAQPVQLRPTVFHIPERVQEQDLVSVMLPFNPAFTPVFEAIRETGAALGLRVLNANQVWEESEIIHDIFSLIYRSAVVVCDFSDRNPNVFYEAGIAHTLGRPVVPLVQRADDIPFDLKRHRHIVYLNNEEGRQTMCQDLMPRLRSLTRDARP